MRYRALVALLLAMCVGFLTACSEEPISLLSDDTYTYDQIRNTGLANSCPQLPETARGSFDLDSETGYILTDLCLEPTSYFVKEESTNKREEAKFIGAKALTRYTSSLTQVTGDLTLDSNGVLTFEEQYGIDFQAITVQLPGGEQVPLLFTIKKLVATTPEGQTGISTSTDLSGDYIVPSYRGAYFLDPKGRGMVRGYDNAVALPAAADDEKIMRENVKDTPVLDGNISLQVSKVKSESGEIAGIFEAIQASDTDLGSKEPVDVKIRGLFYGRVEPKV